MKIVMTGGSGIVGSLIRPLLAAKGHKVTIVDLTEPKGLASSEHFLEASVTDLDAMVAALTGASLLVHLAGHPREMPWKDIVEVNVQGGYTALEAAHRAGMKHVLMASSVHAAGCVSLDDAAAVDVTAIRPDTFYGVGKVAVEALSSLYADRFGMTVVSARIMTVLATPNSQRALSSWLSPADLVRLVEATAALDEPGHHTVWGTSRNSRSAVGTGSGEQIGFSPVDDAESFASGLPDTPTMPSDQFLGGPFLDDAHPVGVNWKRT